MIQEIYNIVFWTVAYTALVCFWILLLPVIIICAPFGWAAN